MTSCSKQTLTFDCIVVGAGVEGSASAYQLARAGVKTLLLEQFSLLHTNGSSHGGSRITRRAYSTCDAALAEETFVEWERVEKLTNKKIYIKTGLVYFGNDCREEIDSVIENLVKYKASHHVLDSAALQAAIPNSQFSDDYYGVYDDQGGVLLADTAVSALQECFRSLGGHILDNCKVTNIYPGHQQVIVETPNANYTCQHLVLCAGTWNAKLTTQLGLTLPLQPQQAYVYYFKEKIPGCYSANKGMTCLIDSYLVYAIPSLEYPGQVKLGIHGGYDYNIDDEQSLENKTPFNVDTMCQYVKDHFPLLDSSAPCQIVKCKYTRTPDEMFILDRHPQHSNVIIAAGFSGTGFKIAPVIGGIVRDLVLGQTPKYDLSPYSIQRFAKL